MFYYDHRLYTITMTYELKYALNLIKVYKVDGGFAIIMIISVGTISLCMTTYKKPARQNI